MMPANVTEAGPAPRHYNREEQPYECSGCGFPRSLAESWPCQGSDTCEARIGECCVQRCEACGLTMCNEHSVDYAGAKWCAHCMALEIEQAEVAK